MTRTALPAPRNPDWENAVRQCLAGQPAMTTLGITLVSLEPGRCVLEMPFDARLTQQTGALHAGITTALADNAGGLAGLSLMPADSEVLAVEFKINLLAPTVGTLFMATGTVLRPGRTLTVTEVDVEAFAAGRRTLVARMQQTLIRIDKNDR